MNLLSAFLSRKYEIGNATFCRYHCDHSIRFTRHVVHSSLRDSIFHAVHKSSVGYAHTKIGVHFDNFVKWNMISSSFHPFQFSVLCFEEVTPENFCPFDYLHLPCDTLILPKKINSVSLETDSIPFIKELVISSTSFVPLSRPYDYPIQAEHPLDIHVYTSLLVKYRTDPNWSTLRFQTPDGALHPITFNGHPPIKDLRRF